MLAAELKPSSIRRYLGSLKQVLDYAGCEPNPARHRTVIADHVGHAQTSMTLDRYSNVMLSTRDVPVGAFRVLLRGISQASPLRHATASTTLRTA